MRTTKMSSQSAHAAPGCWGCLLSRVGTQTIYQPGWSQCTAARVQWELCVSVSVCVCVCVWERECVCVCVCVCVCERERERERERYLFSSSWQLKPQHPTGLTQKHTPTPLHEMKVSLVNAHAPCGPSPFAWQQGCVSWGGPVGTSVCM